MRGLLLGGALAVAGVLGLPLLVVLTAVGHQSPGTAAPSAHALADIPAPMLALYRAAAAGCPGLPWPVLAAIGKAESDHGRSAATGVRTGENSAGAGGPMQFLAGTWAAYGVDADGDGVANRYSPVDAVHSAARYLCASGGGTPSRLREAIWAYNHADSYVATVLAVAAGYGTFGTDVTSGDSSRAAARVAAAFAASQLGTPYRWGGEGPGGFDCSGLVQVAYAAAGIRLPRVAEAQYHAGPSLAADRPLEPGDLVFYGTRGHITHVGTYVGDGNMIDAPHTGAVVRVERYQRSTYVGATRPGDRAP